MNIDIPTALSEVEAVAISQLATGRDVLEVGSLLGFSTVTMGMCANSVVSVDPHEGYPDANPRPTYEPFLQNLMRYDVIDVVTAYREDHRAIDWIKADHPAWDFAFIDADGTYETTFAVLEKVAEATTSKALIAVHDYDLPAWPGAGEAVRDWCTQTGARFGVIDTIALIRKHPDNQDIVLDNLPPGEHPDD